MKLPRPTAFALALATLTTFLVAGTAHADSPLTLTVQPNVVAVGQHLRLIETGCTNRSGPGYYQEPGLAEHTINFVPGDTSLSYWYADATAGDKPGVYTMIAGCAGTSEHVTAKLTITAVPYMRLNVRPNPVIAGQPLHFDFVSCHSEVPPIPTPAVAGGTLVLRPGGGGSWYADVRSGDKPGKYRITANCPAEQDSATAEVTVLARSTPAPPTTSAPVPSTTPQVPVVPKGAPETGGGGLAAEVSTEPVLR